MPEEREGRDVVHCPAFQGALELLGARWTGAILRVLLMGPARFSDLLEHIPRLSSRLLTKRLVELRSAGLVEHTDEATYALTSCGHDLGKAFAELERWTARWADSR